MKRIRSICFILLVGIVWKFSIAASQSDTPVITAFLAMLDGSEKQAQAAIDKYANDEVIEFGMIPFGENPKIISKDGKCCIFSLTYEGEENQYAICEENGKISEFDTYFEYDDEEEY